MRAPIPKLLLAAWLAVIAMTSFFVALTCAYLQRHALSTDWLSPRLAAILSANTFLLIASSVALFRARQFLRLHLVRGTLRWMITAFALGIAFLIGQAVAWRTLFIAGVYVAQHPNSGFFFLATAAHAAHLLVGLSLLAWALAAAWRGRLQPERPLPMDIASVVWHCLDFTWIYLYLALLFYR